MDPASLYRDGSAVTPGLHPTRMPVSNFYSSSRADLGGGGLSAGSGDIRRGSSTDAVTRDLAIKMDQMLDMLSSTQQIVLRQQDTCNRLEENMAKLGSEVAALKDMPSSKANMNSSSSCRPNVPREISVSIIIS